MNTRPFVGRLPFSSPASDPDDSRDFRTHEPEWIWENYFFALGYLMHSYTRVEESLTIITASILDRKLNSFDASNPDHQGQDQKSNERSSLIKSVIGSQRADPALQGLRRLLRLLKASPSIVSDVERVLSHFSDIQFVRNQLAHGSPRHDMTNKDCWFVLENYLTAREPKDQKVLRFRSEMLVRMAWDLSRMTDLLYEATNRLFGPPTEIEKLVGTEWDRGGPWTYKPSELMLLRPNDTSAGRGRQPKGPSPTQPPPSSEA